MTNKHAKHDIHITCTITHTCTCMNLHQLTHFLLYPRLTNLSLIPSIWQWPIIAQHPSVVTNTYLHPKTTLPPLCLSIMQSWSFLIIRIKPGIMEAVKELSYSWPLQSLKENVFAVLPMGFSTALDVLCKNMCSNSILIVVYTNRQLAPHMYALVVIILSTKLRELLLVCLAHLHKNELLHKTQYK